MNDNLYIPEKINVGFQKRTGTYTGNLAYVTYTDSKGVLRKQKSWEEWRDKTIQPVKLDNTPQEGFCLNKEVERYNWSHFSSNRSYIRMYDPRGVEFEISPENLIGILTESNCSKRGLEGKFVYAWNGTELVLLPCVSEEYVKAQEHTKRQEQDVSAKDLKPGVSYTTKNGEEVIFIGKLPVYSYNRDKSTRGFKKKFVFYCPSEKSAYLDGFKEKSDLKFLAFANNDSAVSNYADLVSEWNKLLRSSKIIGFEYPQHPKITDDATIPQPLYFVEKSIKNKDTILSFNYVSTYGHNKYYLNDYSNDKLLINANNEFSNYTDPNRTIRHSYNYERNVYSKEQIIEKINNSIEAHAVLENGNKIKIDGASDLYYK